ncbi:MAG TPA: hypothetical protein VMV86_00095 [Methanosarcinales archaeon]|nr:hypothetical protein [Methanosarcinales archaeon]
MNTEDTGAHRAMASAMDYCELCRIISDLIFERQALSKHLPNQELKKYNKAISIYKEELNFVINLTSTGFHSTMVH